MRSLFAVVLFVACFTVYSQAPEYLHRAVGLGDPLWLIPDADHAFLVDFEREAVSLIRFRKAADELTGWTADTYILDGKGLRHVHADSGTYRYERGLLSFVSYTEGGSPIAWGGGTESEIIRDDGDLVSIRQFYGFGSDRDRLGEYQFDRSSLDAAGRYRQATWISDEGPLPESIEYVESGGRLSEIIVRYEDTDEGYTFYIGYDRDGRPVEVANWIVGDRDTLPDASPFFLVAGYGVPPFGVDLERRILELFSPIAAMN